MRYRRLGDSDLHVSALSFGCGNFGGLGSAAHLFGQGDDEKTARAMLDTVFEAGVTMFDTADSYGGGRSEEWLGRWLADRGVRDRVVVATKVGNRVGPDPGAAGLSERHIRGQVETSLRRLRTDRIDLYLTHVHDPGTPVEESVAAFDRLAREGKIRYYGMSNFTGAQLSEAVAAADRLGAARPVNLQDDYNLINSTAAFAACAAAGVGFTAYSPLAGGLLTGKYRTGTPAGSRRALLPGWYTHHGDGHVQRVAARLQEVAAERGLPPATLALAWVLAEPAVVSALVAPRSQAQFAALLAAPEVPLTPDERARLIAS
ncbi:aldo/keto reductase [Nonomuraea lactucae]|uniref:aldo/keto reductase n=1 Tax=Nonomuraea lactucae TaxID=2249762 RepID=UPI000DE491A6|nr:aldo/keto reductase [Nonomuraea lactucae]